MKNQINVETKDQTTNRDEVGSMAIVIVGLAVIMAALVYEDARTSQDNSGWYHWAILVTGWMMAVISATRFLPVIAMLTIPGGCDQEDWRILQRQGLLFRSQTHFFNWITVLLLGLLLIILELKWEQDWVRSSGLG